MKATAETAVPSLQPIRSQSVVIVGNESATRQQIFDFFKSMSHTIAENQTPNDVENSDRLILVVSKQLPYQFFDEYKKLLDRAQECSKCALIVEKEDRAADKLLERIGQRDYVKRILAANLTDELNYWMKKNIVFALPVGDSAATSQQRQDFEALINFLLQSGYRLRQRDPNSFEWNAISDNMAECDKVIAVYFKPPGEISSHARGHLYQMAFDRMIALREPVMCIVKMYSPSESNVNDKVLQNHRIQEFVKVVEPENRQNVHDAVSTWLTEETSVQIKKYMVFGSLGNGLAWQYATGFLAYILPNIIGSIATKITDSDGFIQENLLQQYELSGIERQKLFILKKYFVLLNEDDIDSTSHVNPNPMELVPKCCKMKRIGEQDNAPNPSTDGRDEEECPAPPPPYTSTYLTLTFESPGYPKIIPLYLVEFDKELIISQSESYSHAIILGGFAPPVTVIRDLREIQSEDLDVSNDKLHNAYKLFKEELQFILNHPRANELLSKFGSVDVSLDEPESFDKAACIVERRRGESNENWHQLFLSRIKEEILSARRNEPIRTLDKQAVEDDVLVVKFSKSVENIHDAVVEKLESAKFRVENFQLLSKSFAEVLVKCRRMVLFASLQDLEDFNLDYSSYDYRDEQHNNLLRDITSAVTYIHMRQEYNLVVVVITENERRDIYSVLPSALQILPEKNVVSILNLSADKLDDIEFAFTEGNTKKASFEQLISRLDLRNPAIGVDENLPLMSMAFAMAANSCFGFVHHLIQAKMAGTLPFELPYKYVIPRSARYPEHDKLQVQLQHLNVSVQSETFANDGRQYRFRLYTWKTDSNERSVAFEVPPCVLNLRKQTKCGLGGVRPTKLRQNIGEYIMAFKMMLDCMGWSPHVQVLEWSDDLFPNDAWRCPTREYAESLRDLVFADVENSS